jgi:DNA polymerase III subunit delta
MAVSDLSELKPVYLIYGSEELLLDRAVRRLKERVAAVADLDFNLEAFDAAESSGPDIVNAANTMPFMSEKRLVIVRDVARLPADDAAALAEYAKDPAPYTCLVLVASKVNKGSKLYRAVDALGGAFEYAAPKRGEYPAEVTRMFAERGKTARRDAAETLVASIGRDLRRLDTEVEKVTAFVGERAEVTRADVVAVASCGATTSVFDYLDAVGSRDVSTALRQLRALIRSGESAMGIHAMSVRHTRSLLTARALMDRGVRTDQMAQSLSMPPWQVRNAVGQAGNFTQAELIEALRASARAEAEMKTSPVDAGLVLERWVVGVCSRPKAVTRAAR